MHRIHIAEYSPEWPVMFRREHQLLTKAIGSYVLDIQHIGSTSVPGLAAKPVIDILIGVEALSIADQYCIQPVILLGYEYVKEYEVQLPFRRYFKKSNDAGVRTHHIHLLEKSSGWWRDHIAFRDYLRNHPEARDQYADLKVTLAGRAYENKHDYTDLKTEFIHSILEKAYSE